MTKPTNLYEYYQSQGQALPSVAERATAAAAAGIQGYTGTAEQNSQLLGHLTSGAATTGAVTPPAIVPPPNTGLVNTQNGVGGPVNSGDLQRMSGAPEPLSIVRAGDPTQSLSGKVSSVATAALGSTDKTVTALRATLANQVAKEKAAADTNVNNIENKVAQNVGSTQIQDTFNNVTDKFQIEQRIKDYEDISSRIVDAQEALNMGLVYEQDRPVREQLLVGRSASLQKQGLATIGALQGTAAVLKGNIDLAYSYANATIDAIKADNARNDDALKTLLDLENKKLVTLTKEERDGVENRIKDIKDQNAKLSSNANSVADLMTKYPTAFLKGGVTLLDSKNSALTKMLPYLSLAEQGKLKSESFTSFQPQDLSTLLATGLNQQDITDLEVKISEYGLDAVLNATGADGKPLLTDTQKSAIQGTVGIPADATDANYAKGLSALQYKQYFDASGALKPGYKLGTDAKGKPAVVEDKPQGGGGVWNWFKTNIFK